MQIQILSSAQSEKQTGGEVILDAVLVFKGWIDQCTDKDVVNDDTANSVLLDSQIKAKLFLDENEFADIRQFANQGIQPVFYVVKVK